MGYKTCLYCGANLDAGEKCGCRNEETAPAQKNEATGTARETENHK